MWRRINDVSLIHAKLQNAFTKCQVMHFTDCFEWLHNRWAHCISQHWLDSKCYCFGEINSVLKLFDYSIDWTVIRLGKVYSVMTNTDIFSNIKFGGDLWKLGSGLMSEPRDWQLWLRFFMLSLRIFGKLYVSGGRLLLSTFFTVY